MEQHAGSRDMTQRGAPTRAGATRRAALHGAVVLGGGLGAALPLAAACGIGQGSNAPAPVVGPAALRYFTDWSGGTRADWIKTALPKFTEENPGITVTAEFAQGDAKEAVLANAAAGTLSDVVLGAATSPTSSLRRVPCPR
jgi:ABC-type glycerol-3-phosphate transport system substrate-binding protein